MSRAPIKKNIDLGEAAIVFMEVAKKFSAAFYADVKLKLEKIGVEFDKKLERQFLEEIAIIHFWIVSLALESDKRLLDEIHKNWLAYRSLYANCETDREVSDFIRTEEKKLKKRYEEYYAKLNSKNGLKLPQAMLVNMLGRTEDQILEEIEFDVWLLMDISSRVFETINAIRNIRKEMKLN